MTYNTPTETRTMRRFMILGLFGVLTVSAAYANGQTPAYEGDVADVRVIRRLEQHPHAWHVGDSGTVDTPRTHIQFGKLKVNP